MCSCFGLCFFFLFFPFFCSFCVWFYKCSAQSSPALARIACRRQGFFAHSAEPIGCGPVVDPRRIISMRWAVDWHSRSDEQIASVSDKYWKSQKVVDVPCSFRTKSIGFSSSRSNETQNNSRKDSKTDALHRLAIEIRNIHWTIRRRWSNRRSGIVSRWLRESGNRRSSRPSSDRANRTDSIAVSGAQVRMELADQSQRMVHRLQLFCRTAPPIRCASSCVFCRRHRHEVLLALRSDCPPHSVQPCSGDRGRQLPPPRYVCNGCAYRKWIRWWRPM